jgi:competence protein CoiA
MQYAIVQGKKSEATRGQLGTCEFCGKPMVAKCGSQIMHHWAHVRRLSCDPWWENETQWHRDWKNEFPSECREVCYLAPDGEVHRADVVTHTGIVIEIQHSAMTDIELKSREEFYGNLVWILDGRRFKDNFHLYHFLPCPDHEESKDIVWFKAAKGMHGANGGIFWRLSENPDHIIGSGDLVLVHGIDEIQALIDSTNCGHQQFDWVRPHSVWLRASCPVYIDFGDEWLFRLEHYGPTGIRCIFRISKRKFIHDAMTEKDAKEIGSRFYPI